MNRDDVRVWRTIVRDVVPLPGRAAEPPPEERRPPPEPSPDLVVMPQRTRPVRGVIEGVAPPGLDRRTVRRLKRGVLPVEASLDLHGLTQAGAHSALISFVGASHRAGRRCLLVVTGKGRMGEGVLRTQVPRWLTMTPLNGWVVRYGTAAPQHGGEGALYLFLRRKDE